MDEPTNGVSQDDYYESNAYFGERAALQAHPACPAGMFDGEGVTWRRQRTRRLADGRKAAVYRLGTKYRLIVDDTPEIQAAKIAERAKADEAKRRTDSAKFELNDAKWRIALLASDAERYREHVRGQAELLCTVIRRMGSGAMPHMTGGYTLDEDTQGALAEHALAILSILDAAPVIFDADRHAAAENAIMAKARAIDPAFGKTLSEIQQGAL